MADDKEIKTELGTIDPGEVRRIGFAHAVILKPREPKLVDLNALRVTKAQVDRRIEQLTTELRSLEAQRDDLANNIRIFGDLPIERIEGDPDVPLTDPAAPVVDPAAAVAADSVKAKPLI